MPRIDATYAEPFTRDELRELARKIKSPTGRRLLWEVSRLRAIVRQADRFERCFSASPESADGQAVEIAAEELRKLLEGLEWLAEEGRQKPAGRPTRRTKAY